MGFYYGSSEPPPDRDEPGGIKDALLITLAVFRALALPLAVIFGGMLGLLVVFWLFTVTPWAGLGAILAIVAAFVGYGYWEYRHPPELQ